MAINRSGFTFIEVLAGTVILVIGIFASIALVVYGQRLASHAQAEAQGMATAMTAAVDPTPLVATGETSWDATATNWTTYDFATSGTIHTEGWLNGLYVQRDEVSTDADAVDPGMKVRSASVTVRVYESEGLNVQPVASFTTRIMRQRSP